MDENTKVVGVLPIGVTPTSEFVSVHPFLDGDIRVTQRFILVRAKEGPTSSGGETLYYLAPNCLYRGEYKWMWLRVLSPSRWWWYENCVLYLFWVSRVSSPTSPFIVPRGGLGYRV